MYRGRGGGALLSPLGFGILKGVFDFLPHTPNNIQNLGLYTGFGDLTSKFGEMAAILIFGHFCRGKILRFWVGSTKMAIKSSKMHQFSQAMSKIKAKRYSYENVVVWSAKIVSF